MQGEGGSGTLRNSLLKSRIAKLPHLPAIAPERSHSGDAFGPSGRRDVRGEAEEEESETGDSLGSLGAPRSSNRHRHRGPSAAEAFSPLKAEDCFQDALEVEVDEGDGSERSASTFRVYYTPPSTRSRSRAEGSALSSTPADIDGGLGVKVNLPALAGDDEADEEEEDAGGAGGSDSAGTVFLLHHGAGYSALSFALVAKSITRLSKGRAGVLAYDCRGHGRTTHPDRDSARSMSLSALTRDGLAILAKLFPPSQPQPTLILVGHSMGGAVVVSMAHALADSTATTGGRAKVAGVAVLDVVEGTAIEALPGMKTIVSQLPAGFASVSEAVRWHVDSGTIVNADSARRSVPSLLRENEGYVEPIAGPTNDEPVEVLSDSTHEEAATPQTLTAFRYVWRHDLMSTEPHWRGWFEGLSKAFLSVKCARLLLLAGTDRLDKDLMIGQMQGKYQLVVFQDVGHSLQEDAPQRTAETLIEFWRRNEGLDVNALRGLRKVGQA